MDEIEISEIAKNPAQKKEDKSPKEVQPVSAKQQEQLDKTNGSVQQGSLSSSSVIVDELSSFGATKQARLPALIKIDQSKESADKSKDEQSKTTKDQQQQQEDSLSLGGFQIVDMEEDGGLVTPSLPNMSKQIGALSMDPQSVAPNTATFSASNLPTSQLGDSLIDMIVNLKNENQNLLQALQRNNDYVRDRIDDFKLLSEDAKKKEELFAKERADFEHEERKLKRQNLVLSERLKSMEAKLKEMKIEISDSLAAAHSSRASSNQADFDPSLYPQLDYPSTMKMDVANEELDQEETGNSSSDDHEMGSPELQLRANGVGGVLAAADLARMTKDELKKHFEQERAKFCAIDDRLKQCDCLEQQLNDLGKRDYEICLLQQRLNIFRQDYRLNKMVNSEAKAQIEKLKSDIDELSMKRVQERAAAQEKESSRHHNNKSMPRSAERLLGRIGRQAARSAATAAKYAAKQAHLEQKAAAVAASVAAKYAQAQAAQAAKSQEQTRAKTTDKVRVDESSHHGGRRSHKTSNGEAPRRSSIKNEVVGDLWETANKAMVTGYKMASTHVNLALDKLSEFEQSQAAQLAKNKTNQEPKPSAPAMQH